MSVSSQLDSLESAWALSDTFFADNSIERQALCRPISLRNPFIFYFGHLPSFAWITLRPLLNANALHPTFDDLFSRGIDPDVEDPTECHDHPAAPVKWPSWSEVLSYRDAVRTQVRERIAAQADDTKELAHTIRLVAEHEAMHVETLHYMLAQQQRPTKNCCLRDAERPQREFRDDKPPCYTWIEVEGADVPLGVPSHRGFHWDNERNAASAGVTSFSIAQHAVSVGDFLRFVRAGGYLRRELWSKGHWAWICREGMQHPLSWMCNGDGAMEGDIHVLTSVGPGMEGHGARVDYADMLQWPVSVSLAEALAYAKWSGASLPSEPQWLLAAYGNEGARGNGGHVDVMTGRLHSVSTGCLSTGGAVGLVGNGWELTTTLFEEFEGFRPTERYPEYSKDFFDSKHYVLKGASWVTHEILVRGSFRNFFQAMYPYVFSKFRLVLPQAGDGEGRSDE
ncbi:unnamed protein product [Chondrus crispus]|uniref:Sulfatase-modifying factor enzyme domain-containing protein n=1 Tax=Chondrus crispus TaxID=2769 RepID=R7QHQ9_CHOCR|nr:unnamed protein product [Chondrus crispus]CDF37614.1 unnamed protein product [Chondrus crispus]|eukprot:XP_005717485.1 unnamed protein product [Chondrus crispus]